MPELFTDGETGPQRRDWLADDAVCGEPVSAANNREKYREISISRMESRTSCFAGADFAGISWPFAHNK
jgi:hypothetical protein